MMENKKISVVVTGDSGNDYNVAIAINESKIFVTCDCPAGSSNTRCKHVLSVIDGDFSRVKDEKDRDMLKNIFSEIKILHYGENLFNELENIEKMEKNLKENRKKIKKEIDRLFFSGIPYCVKKNCERVF